VFVCVCVTLCVLVRQQYVLEQQQVGRQLGFFVFECACVCVTLCVLVRQQYVLEQQQVGRQLGFFVFECVCVCDSVCASPTAICLGAAAGGSPAWLFCV